MPTRTRRSSSSSMLRAVTALARSMPLPTPDLAQAVEYVAHELARWSPELLVVLQTGAPCATEAQGDGWHCVPLRVRGGDVHLRVKTPQRINRAMLDALAAQVEQALARSIGAWTQHNGADDDTALAEAMAVRTERPHEELALLQETGTLWQRGLSLEQTLDAILDAVARLVLYDAAEVSLFDRERNVLVGATHRGNLLLTPAAERVYSVEASLGGWLIEHRRPLRIGDSAFKQIVPQVPPLAYEVKSHLGAPLLAGSDVVGTLQMAAIRPDAFSADDERLLELLATQAAQAIRNTQRFAAERSMLDERTAQWTALQRITNELNATLDLHHVLRAILFEALGTTPATQGSVALWQAHTQQFRFSVVMGYNLAEEGTLLQYVFRRGEPGAGDAAAIRMPTEIVATTGQARITPAGLVDITGSGAGVDVPIMYQKRTVGVLTLRAPQPHAFSADQLPFLALLCEQAALAMAQAAHVAEQRKQRELAQQRAHLLSEVLDIGNRQRTDRPLEDTLTDIAYGVMNAVGFRTVVLNLVYPERPDWVQPVAFAGVARDYVDFLRTHPLSLPLITKLLDPRYQISQSFYLPEAWTQEVLRAEVPTPTVITIQEDRKPDEWQPDEMLLTPLYGANGQLLGVLSVDDPFDRRRPTRRMVETLEIFANQAKVFIENARLYTETQRQLAEQNALNHVSRTTSGLLDVRAIIHEIFNSLRTVIHFDSFYGAVYYPGKQLGVVLTWDEGTWRDADIVVHLGRGLNYHTVQQRRPLLFGDLRVEAAALPPAAQPVLFGDTTRRSASWMGVPLIVRDDEVIGVLSLHSYTTHAFTQRDLAFLEAVGRQTALTIQNARLFGQTEDQIKQLQALSDIGQVTGSTLDIEQMFLGISRGVLRYRPVGAFLLATFDLERYTVTHTLIVEGETHQFLYTPWQITPNSYTHHLIESGTSLLIRNADEGLGVLVPMHVGDEQHPLSWAGVLLRTVDGAPFGVMAMQSYAANAFDERDIAFLGNVAHQVALNIQNARLFAQTRTQVQQLEDEAERMRLINRVSVAASATLDLPVLLQLAVDELAQAVRADQARLALFDRDQDRAVVATEYVDTGAVGILTFPLESNRSIAWMDEHHTSMLVEDVQNDPGFQNMRDIFVANNVGSILIVPLVVKNEVIGSVGLDKRDPFGSFAPRDLETCQTIANQIAIAIENARLLESEQNKRQIADTLREVALSLTSTLDVGEVLEIVLEQLQRVVPYDSASMQLLRPNDRLEIIAQRGLDAELAAGLSFPAHDPRYPNGDVLRLRQPVVVGDTLAEYPVFGEAEHARRIRAWLGVPLLHGNQVLGMITLDSHQPHFYTPAMADLAQTFATQAATALYTAQLFDQIRNFNTELEGNVQARTAELRAEKDRLEALHTITTTLTASLDSDDIVRQSLQLAADAVGVACGMVLIRDVLQDVLVCRAQITPSGGLATLNQVVDGQDGGLAEWVLLHQQGARIADVHGDTRWNTHAAPPDVRSALVMPLQAADVQLGVIMLFDHQPNTFTDEHMRLLQTIANEVAIALNNAELYDLINDQAARLAEMLQLQRQEASQNRAILESVAEGVLVIDDRNLVMLFNPAAADVLQVPMETVYGRALDRLAEWGPTPEAHERSLLIYAGLVDGVRSTYKHAEPQNVTLELPGQTIAATFAPVATNDGMRVGTAAVLRDISREIEADKSKRAFISTVSHELRTPLTSIKGYIDLLMMNTAGPISDMQRSFLEVVKTNADRLNALVQDLLEISRLENGNVQLNFNQFSMNSMITDLLQSLRPETERKRMGIALELDPALSVVEADEKRVGQVVLNLLSNAHKYTFEGGTITVRTRVDDDMLRVDVQDTGVGISREDLPKMFGRFFRTDNPLKEIAGGTGLGLSIAKSFIELHHGRMWVESVAGQGSMFSFTLPFAQTKPDLEDDLVLSVS